MLCDIGARVENEGERRLRFIRRLGCADLRSWIDRGDVWRVVARVIIEGPTGFAPLRDERDRGVFWSEETTSLVRIFITNAGYYCRTL
jgi:hypothetical protein